MQPATLSDLESEAADVWARIVDGTAAFDRVAREAAAVRRCTLKDARKVFATCLAPSSESRRCLIVEVHVGGTGAAAGQPPQLTVQAARRAPGEGPGVHEGDSRGGGAWNLPHGVDCGVKQHVVRHRRGHGVGQVSDAGDGLGDAAVCLRGPYLVGVDAQKGLGGEPVCWHGDDGGIGEEWQRWQERLHVFADRM